MPIQKNVLSVSVKKGLLHFLTVVAALAVVGTGLTLASPASANSATSSADALREKGSVPERTDPFCDPSTNIRDLRTEKMSIVMKEGDVIVRR